MENKLSHHSKTMEEFRNLISREKECAKKVDPSQKDWDANLDAAIDRTKDCFTVVIMGNFSAGKTTMINALIGDRLLPMSATPTTAVMTELKYGEQKKIIMYPKKGTNVDGKGDKPFTVPATTESIERYVTIDNEAGINSQPQDSVKIASQFEKMELYWPLDILKNGVVIVDSPGLNDPYSNDQIVKNYLPHADAVIYTMPSTSPYGAPDVKELNGLNSYNIRNIIFAYTYWDQIAFDGEKSIMKTKGYCIDNSKKHTDLGEDAIHFLSSREGLKARIESDSDLLVKSGYARFETFLADYLTSARGKDKVKNLVGAMEFEADRIRKHAMALNNNAVRDSAEIEENMKRAQSDLTKLEKEGKQIVETFDLKLQTKMPSVERTVENFIPTLKDSVNLDDFSPETEIPSGLGNLNPVNVKKAAKKVYDEFQEEYNRRLRHSISTWTSSELYREMANTLEYAAEGIKDDTDAFAAKLEKIDATIGIDEKTGGTSSGTVSSVLLGVVYGIITQDWFTGATVAVYGKGTMLRQLGYQAAWGAAAGLAVAVGIPITWPILIAGGIIATLIGIIMQKGEKKVEKMRKEVLSNLREAYFGSSSSFISDTKNSIMTKVKEVFSKAKGDIQVAIDADVNNKKQSIEAIIKADGQSKDDKKKGIELRKKAVDELDKVIEEALALKSNY